MMWTLNVDGSAGKKHKDAEFILEDLDSHQYTYAMKFLFPVNNNEAEYEVVLAGLCIACILQIIHLRVLSNLEVVIRQEKRDFKAKEDNIQST